MVARKTNNGQSIDLDALIANSNKNSPAVGNMKVNAKGDILGPGGEVIKKSEDRVRDYYRDNPRSSTSQTSVRQNRGESRTRPAQPEPSLEENITEPDEFEAPTEPLGYREVELPNGDIEVVPYYTPEENNERSDDTNKNKRTKNTRSTK